MQYETKREGVRYIAQELSGSQTVEHEIGVAEGLKNLAGRLEQEDYNWTRQDSNLVHSGLSLLHEMRDAGEIEPEEVQAALEFYQQEFEPKPSAV